MKISNVHPLCLLYLYTYKSCQIDKHIPFRSHKIQFEFASLEKLPQSRYIADLMGRVGDILVSEFLHNRLIGCGYILKRIEIVSVILNCIPFTTLLAYDR